MITIYEPRHEISNNVVCATCKGSDQPVHMHSLIRAFASHLNNLTVKLLTNHHLECLGLIGGYTDSSCQNTTLLKITCWAQLLSKSYIYSNTIFFFFGGGGGGDCSL